MRMERDMVYSAGVLLEHSQKAACSISVRLTFVHRLSLLS